MPQIRLMLPQCVGPERARQLRFHSLIVTTYLVEMICWPLPSRYERCGSKTKAHLTQDGSSLVSNDVEESARSFVKSAGFRRSRGVAGTRAELTIDLMTHRELFLFAA